ncbi:transcriptional regulator, PucR family [Alkaliphilus metalliredigens QYMF]|uniref:Transcriptional regulator, PucR family n=1 Tax=Alkaliphilus metalliredigens (strain QYMF) TaxID=293826 RepID=A6TL42_ALKMQ|nr:PucR family transcriptional regulator [Alkaliphilus metalliredigens]ABR46910.1 transcriptional regulator, PucR family [Alkaliphilus metalliredigens QYMF]
MEGSSGMTVEGLLGLEGMAEAKIRAGRAGVHKMITKINVMEVPDIIDWVEEGEFLLTTAYSIKDDLHKLRDLISQLSQKGIVGLGIKTKRYIESIPADVIERAEELNFPLIEIPYEISYATIISRGLTEIISNQRNLLQQTEFFEDLLSRDLTKHQRALDRGTYFQFDSQLSYTVIVISINERAGCHQYSLETSNEQHGIKLKLLRIVKNVAKNQKKKVICGNKRNQMVVLYGASPNTESIIQKNEVMNYAEEVMKHGKFEAIGCISIGIGRNYDVTKEIWKSYEEANRAVECGRGRESRQVVHYDGLGIYRILSYENLHPELIQLYQEVLEPLVKYDEDKGTELVKTVKMFFKYNGNIKRISTEMYTHYNTIVYRIQRIQEITQMDLEDDDTRLNVHLALKILEMQLTQK